ncbi:hypothetical protein [Kushneria aurantia]|uniref:Uncharacterized protein n=1 Tax=Kushneria aurantia TaxID=504092 RepID=A0ABV6FZC9_9GAMM|nr:hypothetical protein [Kushneria aurantia]
MSDNISRKFVSGVHQLLGSTLRDSRRERQGRIVGIDQTREHPVIDIVWQGQAKAERTIITFDQLDDLVRACAQRDSGSKAPCDAEANGGGSEPSATLEQRYRA